ncbi:MAG: PadR family transcriptional regulator, partial [Propionibacteriaceae bacterium]|nr:PadR family transcriptional regulator [Propionibacteriaceae bacterium]
MFPPDPQRRRHHGGHRCLPDGSQPGREGFGFDPRFFDPRFEVFAEFGWRGRGRARRGKLRDSILVLLAERPRNGYQLMAELAERTLGAWQPSPGAVYPCLTQLAEEDLIEAV